MEMGVQDIIQRHYLIKRPRDYTRGEKRDCAAAAAAEISKAREICLQVMAR
jgi:hypothetical protein